MNLNISLIRSERVPDIGYSVLWQGGPRRGWESFVPPFTSGIAGNAIHKENFKHPTEDKNVPKTLASNQWSRTYSQFEEYRAGASILAHELGKARCGHGTFRSRTPWISIALSMSVFRKLAVPKRDLNATLSLLTRSRRFIIFTIIRGSYSPWVKLPAIIFLP